MRPSTGEGVHRIIEVHGVRGGRNSNTTLQHGSMGKAQDAIRGDGSGMVGTGEDGAWDTCIRTGKTANNSRYTWDDTGQHTNRKATATILVGADIDTSRPQGETHTPGCMKNRGRRVVGRKRAESMHKMGDRYYGEKSERNAKERVVDCVEREGASTSDSGDTTE